MSVRAAILDVGQGDTIVLTSGKGPDIDAVVIDCIDAHKVLKYLSRHQVKTVKAVFITHLHSDHFRQVRALLEALPGAYPGEIPPWLIYKALPELNKVPELKMESSTRKQYDQLERWALANHTRVQTACISPQPALGKWNTHLEVLHPHETHYSRLFAGDFNDTSLIIKVKGEKSSLLLCGDVQKAGFEACANFVKEKLRADFLKVPHHGAWRDINNAEADFVPLVTAVNPRQALISVGTIQKNYGHPNLHVLEALKSSGVTVRCTQATPLCTGSKLDAATQCAGDIFLDLDAEPAEAYSHVDHAAHVSVINKRCSSHRCCSPSAGS